MIEKTMITKWLLECIVTIIQIITQDMVWELDYTVRQWIDSKTLVMALKNEWEKFGSGDSFLSCLLRMVAMPEF